MTFMTSTSTPPARSSPDAHISPVARGRDQLISSACAASALSDDDDDDEIVWPVSSQKNSASSTPIVVEGVDAIKREDGTESVIASSIRGDASAKSNNNASLHAKGRNADVVSMDSFFEDIVLERGDCGSKLWTPPPSVQRPRGRGHRSTKSESAAIAPPVFTKARAEVGQSWADDVTSLEERMGRASLVSVATRPRSTLGSRNPQLAENGRTSPRKQRGQKKQKGKRRPRATSSPGNNTPSNNTKAASRSYPSPAPSPTPDCPPSSGAPAALNSDAPSNKKARKGRGRKNVNSLVATEPAPSTAPSTPLGLGTRSIVDDVSENGDAVQPPQSVVIYGSETDRLLSMAYDEAVKFMNAFVRNPDFYTSRASRLTFLQALIIELGLVSANGPERSLPGSLSAAKALLRSHAFLNIKDYLAERENGLAALRSVMRPSRSALVRDLRGRNGRRAKLGWVKETGLNVLLVSCQY